MAEEKETPAQGANKPDLPEIKEFLILKEQMMYIDAKAGIRLNLFAAENSFCKTPERVKKNLAAYPTLVAALRLGHIITSDEKPEVFQRGRPRQSETPFSDLLELDVQALRARLAQMKSVELIDQLVTMEQNRHPKKGGSRPQYLNILQARKDEIMRSYEKTNEKAYSDNQAPLEPAAVAKLAPKKPKQRTQPNKNKQ